MDRVRLGRTGLDVSVVCFGTGGASRLGRTYGVTDDEGVRLVRTALDNGVDFVDTARSYGTEAIVGRAVAGRRDQVTISTKTAVTDAAGGFLTGADLVTLVEESLARLGTDRIDVMYLHGVLAGQYARCVEEFLPVLRKLRDQGKVRFLGLSERFLAESGHEVLELALADGHFDVLMVALNVVNQSALRTVLPAARRNGIGVQCMYAVRGKLAARDTAAALVADAVARGEVDPADLDPADPLGFLVAPGVADSLTEACYRFVRHAAGVHTVLTGTGRPAHLLENIRSINGPPLPDGVLARLSRMFGRVRSVTGD